MCNLSYFTFLVIPKSNQFLRLRSPKRVKRTEKDNIRVLVAPLDWGLGHTTRCFPIIYELLLSGAEVLLAGNTIQKKILEQEFHTCKFVELGGYNIEYSKSGRDFVWKILRQAPGVLNQIKKEQYWLSSMVEKEGLDGVISDNRFGLYSTVIPSVFITHQLLIKNNWGTTVEAIVQKLNYRYINKFDTCWIPDFSGMPNLAGDLSHPQKMPGVPCHYVQPLSRMSQCTQESEEGHILIMLSGPEPQRTIFEKMVFKQLEDFKGSATVVRGLPFAPDQPVLNGVVVHNHLSKEELNKEMCRAEYIICRSGYSSVMDIAAVGRKSIQVPTPGQTEQEYLAGYLSSQNFCITVSQSAFNLNEVLEKARTFNFENNFPQQKYSLEKAVQKFLDECRTRKIKRRPESSPQ